MHLNLVVNPTPNLKNNDKFAKEAEGRLFFGVEVGARFQQETAADGPAIGCRRTPETLQPG